MNQTPETETTNAPDPQNPASHMYHGNRYGYGHDGYYGGAMNDHGSSQSITINSILRILRRKWPLLLLGAVLGAGGALVQAMMTPKSYRASSSVQMSIRRPRVMSGGEAVLQDHGSAWNAEKVFNTRIEKFRGKATRKIAQTCFSEQLGPDATLPSVSFNLVKDSFLVNITCVSQNPEVAKEGANAYAQATVQVMADENREMSDSAVLWLQKQATSKKQELERAEKEIADFRVSHSLDLLENQKGSLESALNGLTVALTEVQAKLLQTKELYESLNQGEVPDAISASAGMADQFSNLRQARIDEKALLARYKGEHPKVVAAREKIQLLETSLKTSVAEAATRTASEVKLLTKQMQALATQIAKHEQAVAQNEENSVRLRSQLTGLERERDVAEMSYQSFLGRMEEARTSSDENTVAVKVVTSAETPQTPFNPKPIHAALAGLLLGLILGGALAFLQDWLEDYVTATEDLEEGLGLKVLGVLPNVKEATDRSNVALSAAKRTNNEFFEAIAGVRATIFSGLSDPPKTILISSAGVQCGKTIVACNLATMIARCGQRTLLVDLDIRRPRVARIFSIKLAKETSLAHALSRGHIQDYASLVNKTEVEGLDVAGSLADLNISPTEIIGGKALQAFLEWAHTHYDNVVIDSPPHGLMSDALVLAGHVDAVLLVCRHEKSRKRAIRHALNKMNHVGDNLLGIVVNGAPLGGSAFSKYDYYHGSYQHSEYVVSGDAKEIRA